MSKKKRAIEKQKKENSAKKKAKRAKKERYAYGYDMWQEKKRKKQEKQLEKREGMGISVECPLQSWETPSNAKCKNCKLKCSFQKRS